MIFKDIAQYEENDSELAKYTIQKQQEEIEKLKKENNDLRKLYQRTYKRLFEIGNDELAGYFQAQIDECPTFYVEPIIDYYQETKRLNNIINELENELKDKATLKIDKYGNTMKTTHIDINWLLDKIKELKGEDKE